MIHLAEIEYFLECTCMVGWHPCKLWYGNPVQVWTTVKSPSIKSRVVYSRCIETFGNLSVYVVAPLLRIK